MDDPGIPEKLLTMEEVAKALAISRSLSYRLAQEGAFPIVRIGKAMRVRPQDLRDYVQSLIKQETTVAIDQGDY